MVDVLGSFHLHSKDERVTGDQSPATQAAWLCVEMLGRQDDLEGLRNIVGSRLAQHPDQRALQICDIAFDELLYNDYNLPAAWALTRVMIEKYPENETMKKVITSKMIPALRSEGQDAKADILQRELAPRNTKARLPFYRI